ncbi:MAG: glycine cleavage system aminomethyltransferase GcvT [Clostridiales bacterium]|nr:glycine cleavage system aminomethyltransferase GcvT [Clostridiales bacterium]
MKKTPINELHKELGGKLIDFGGWELPVLYTSIIEEHNAVRENAGLFDVSHMGEITIKGRDAKDFVNYLITNDIKNMKEQQIIYTPMCYQDGGTVDDLLVYKKNEQDYFLVVNASNVLKDFKWISDQVKDFKVTINNVSNDYAQIAIQGPKAEMILQKLTSTSLQQITFFTFNEAVDINGIKALVSRTGYTGEDGFEIYADAKDGSELFSLLLHAGKDHGILPCGLGARDTLRFESALPLYGHELTKDITPVEAGLTYFIKPEKDKFIGKDKIVKQIEEKPKRRLVGFEMIDKGIARSEYTVLDEEGNKIGFVTSGSFSPSLQKNLGLALVERSYRKRDTLIYIEVRNKIKQAKVVKKPFYKKKYKK